PYHVKRDICPEIVMIENLAGTRHSSICASAMGEIRMKSSLAAGVLAIAILAVAGVGAAHAMSCQLITTTHSARSWASAAQTSQALAVETPQFAARQGMEHPPSVRLCGGGRSVLEGGEAAWRAGEGQALARYRHAAILHDVLHRRRRALRLHHRIERLRPITA